MEPGTKVEIHRHPTKDESFVLLRGRVRVNTYNDGGTVIESVVLCPEEGLYGDKENKMGYKLLEYTRRGMVSVMMKG